MSAPRARPALVLLGLFALAGACVWLLLGTPGSLLNGPPPRLGPEAQPDETVVVHVDQGDSAATIGRKLEQTGVIDSARLFRVLASLMAVGARLEAGDYEFHKGESAMVAVQRISQGITASRIVTIPEGLRAEEIGALLERNGVVSAEDFRNALAEQYTASFIETRSSLDAPPPRSGLEGFLFPATYGFPMQIAPHQVVQQLVAAFDERYRTQIQPLLAASNLSLHDAVTLAAIVEREAQLPEERPVIASVFLNRLAAGMPLQADPTVQYALGSDPANAARFGYWKPDLTLADLAIDSPYNTYVHAGLPPGPIANPGLDSILAVLRPAQTDYLYFVARPNGSHAFAATLEEHQRNVCSIDPTRPEC
jgi:UPF0755 protein